jgi:hypothetical protein
MSLLLIEARPSASGREAVDALLDQIAQVAAADGGDVIEAQVTSDHKQVFTIVEHASCGGLRATLDAAGVTVDTVEPVRLVGADIEDVKAQRGKGGRYLVEWDLPEGLTMDAYLTRKKEKAPLYAQVPDATFLRTYVREDLEKCLCFYDGADEDAVRRARDVVSAPVDRFHELDG